ncbi:GyrI-like domain-containing protein [Winogradskyella endarachnes]|uniref:GyrI-like domain-containing protein n=1 Tax=Winogradskyella endarachnes TaxID=2681965 RepID=A0A6L6U8A1_9FLAO|nr:GyrI-like domain-containing protein [Winogradskyella endarachnes]MUU77127.1 GyrI-like domain-containing protein [Winogradskyella endarachnes]
MKPKLVAIADKYLVGNKSRMLHGQYANIVSLWKKFRPRSKEILNNLNSEYIAIQVYEDFNSTEKAFDIWACVEVSDFENIPKDMLKLTILKGLYAVFNHKGINAAATYQSIITEWLPTSGYKIDNRPHFQVMGERYINGSPDSEEDFYVPICSK